ncbi:hypothetical protein GW846_03000 [Candidatus Gracilibacteria bacterium]|nr:hypothetical protein [Candidatus Gracilibacteria bacterium]
MKNTKTLLLAQVANVSKETLLSFSTLPYTKIRLLYSGNKDTLKIKIPSNISIVSYTGVNGLNRAINTAYTDFPEYMVLPLFSGDDNSKYAIKVFNKSFGSKINPKIFKEKDVMQKFLGDVGEKNIMKRTYKEVMHMEYDELLDGVGPMSIIKPTNASASRSTFKITSKEDFLDILPKLSRNFDYMIEEYIGGELYSVDVFYADSKMYLLTYAREIAMIELSDKNKFSKEFLAKYGEELQKHFNFILPISYHLDFSMLAKLELSLLEQLRVKLEEIDYRGVIHLEYKYDKTAKKIGFLEWGARYGGYRKIFIKEIYNTDIKRIPYYLLVEKDTSRFKQLKGNIYSFKEQEHNLNFVRIKTNFVDTTNYIDILKKTGNIFEVSFQSFLKDYFLRTFGIRIKKIDFYVKYSSGFNFFPFYREKLTKLDYILEFDDENFELYKKKKFKIIEKTFFHDYK